MPGHDEREFVGVLKKEKAAPIGGRSFHSIVNA